MELQCFMFVSKTGKMERGAVGDAEVNKLPLSRERVGGVTVGM